MKWFILRCVSYNYQNAAILCVFIRQACLCLGKIDVLNTVRGEGQMVEDLVNGEQ